MNKLVLERAKKMEASVRSNVKPFSGEASKIAMCKRFAWGVQHKIMDQGKFALRPWLGSGRIRQANKRARKLRVFVSAS